MGNSEKYGKTLVTLGAQNCQESRYCVERSLNRDEVEQKVPLPLPNFGTFTVNFRPTTDQLLHFGLSNTY